MKILMLVNWKTEYCDVAPADKQPPDYVVKGEPYWFFRYFKEQPEVDVVDISSFPWLERFEKNKIRFYIWQTLRVLPRLNQYDLILSHGMQSGVVLSLWRRLFKGKAKHIVFDIGSFNSAAESGFALKLMQFVSKSIDGLIYHTSSQMDYYKRFFPRLAEKSRFVRFGADLDRFAVCEDGGCKHLGNYVLCVGFEFRDRETLTMAYRHLNSNVKLRFVGYIAEKFKNVPGIEQFPVVPVTELMDHIQGAQFCVLPLESFNYSYGQMTLLQQMAMGKCVIAARVPSLVDYVEDGVTALLYEPKNADDLAEKMRLVLDNPEKCRKIAENAQVWLQTRCNEKIMAAEIEKVIEDICQRCE